MYSALIVENEAIISTELASIIRKIGDIEVVSRIRSLSKALEYLRENRVEFAFLDINLSGEFEGIDIAEFIQTHAPETVIIFITAYTDDDILNAISAIGYEAYIVKPFSSDEIQAVVKLALMKLRQKKPELVCINADYEYDMTHQQLFFQKRKIELTVKEMLFIHCLVKAKGTIVPMSVIDDTVWPGESVTENSRRNMIYKLKKRLPAPCIKVKYGVGYTLLNT